MSIFQRDIFHGQNWKLKFHIRSILETCFDDRLMKILELLAQKRVRKKSSCKCIFYEKIENFVCTYISNNFCWYSSAMIAIVWDGKEKLIIVFVLHLHGVWDFGNYALHPVIMPHKIFLRHRNISQYEFVNFEMTFFRIITNPRAKKIV